MLQSNWPNQLSLLILGLSVIWTGSISIGGEPSQLYLPVTGKLQVSTVRFDVTDFPLETKEDFSRLAELAATYKLDKENVKDLAFVKELTTVPLILKSSWRDVEVCFDATRHSEKNAPIHPISQLFQSSTLGISISRGKPGRRQIDITTSGNLHFSLTNISSVSSRSTFFRDLSWMDGGEQNGLAYWTAESKLGRQLMALPTTGDDFIVAKGRCFGNPSRMSSMTMHLAPQPLKPNSNVKLPMLTLNIERTHPDVVDPKRRRDCTISAYHLRDFELNSPLDKHEFVISAAPGDTIVIQGAKGEDPTVFRVPELGMVDVAAFTIEELKASRGKQGLS